MSRQKHFLYTSGDYIVGETNAGNLGLNYVYNNKYLLNIGYSASAKAESSLPEELTKSGKILSPAYHTDPFQNHENIHIMIGRILNLNRNKTVRIIIQGGPGISTSRKPKYSVIGNKYHYKMKATQSPCLTINPKLEMPFCSTLGFSLGPLLIVSSEQKYIGAGLGIMYGVLRN